MSRIRQVMRELSELHDFQRRLLQRKRRQAERLRDENGKCIETNEQRTVPAKSNSSLRA